MFNRDCLTIALPDAAVVYTVKTVLPLPPVAIVTLAGFKLQVGGLCAPAGDPVSVQVIFRVPEYVLLVDKVAVAVVVAPGDTGDGGATAITTWETVTVAVPFELAYVASPE
jgi:hypothetical protein